MKQWRHVLTVALIVSGLLIVIVSSGKTADTRGQAKPMPAKLTIADLEKLRWIEGTWRGNGGGVEPFFERYRFENAMTLAVDGFDNEKLEKITDTTRYELKAGEFGGGSEDARYVATAIDDNSIAFAPVVKARNSFVWKRDSKDRGRRF